MNVGEIAEMIGNWGGLIILAALFVYTYVQDKNKNSKLMEELSKSNADNSKAITALVESNKNIATSLEIIKGSLVQIDSKADRNYEEIVHYIVKE